MAVPHPGRLASAAGFTAFEPLMFPREIFPLHGDLRTMSGGQIVRLLGDHGMVLAGLHVAAIPLEILIGAFLSLREEGIREADDDRR